MATSTPDRQHSSEEQPIILRVASDAWNWSKIPVMEIVETLSSSYVGQMVLKFADKFLWVVEKSSQWALPPPPAPANDKTVVTELTRPLPWLLFLPTLFWLRIFREMLSFCALLMGMEPIRPSSVVRFIQNCRKSLRSIKYNGIRSLRTKHAIRPEEKNVGLQSWIFWIIIKLQSMLCYNPVIYAHAPHKNLTVRKNSGEKIVVTIKKKGSSSEIEVDTQNQQKQEQQHQSDVEVEDFDASIFKKLVQDLEQFIDSDDDDSDFSVTGEDAEDTLATSIDDEDEGYYQPEDEQYQNDKQNHQGKGKTKSPEVPNEKLEETTKKIEVPKIVENGNKEGSLTNGSSEPKTTNVTNKTVLNNEAAAGSSQLQITQKESKETLSENDTSEKVVVEKVTNSSSTAKKLNRDRRYNNRSIPRTNRKGVSSSTKQKNGQTAVKAVTTVEQSVVKNSTVESNRSSVVEQSVVKNSTVELNKSSDQSKIPAAIQENSVSSQPITTGQSLEKNAVAKEPLDKNSTMEKQKNSVESPKKPSTLEVKEKPKETQPHIEQNTYLHT